MKQVIHQLAFIFCKISGLNIIMRFRNRNKARVLMYHAVSDKAPDSAYWTVVTTERFHRQLKHLKRHYRTVSGVEFAESSSDQLKNKVLITFDDGHVNTLTTALPELKRFKLPAVCFVIPGLSESGKFVWADELHNRMMAAAPTTLQTSLGKVRLDADTNLRTKAVNTLIEQMKTGSNELRLRVYDEISCAVPAENDSFDGALKLMSKEEIIELSREPLIDIGTHTDTHPILSSLSVEEQSGEIESGLDRLRSWGIDGSVAFAYPNGRPCDYNFDSIEAVRQAGIIMAFTTRDGFVEADDGPYEYRRIPVGDNTSQYEFEARLSGAYYFIRRLSGRGEQAALRRKSSAQLITSTDALAALKSEWDALVERTPRRTIFLYYDWLMTWWEVHGGGHELGVLKIEEDGRLIGLVPLMITRAKRKRVVEFIGTPDADYGDFIGPNPEKIAREAVNWLLDNQNRWDEISLMQVSELSPANVALRKVLDETGANWFAKPVATCYRYTFTDSPEKRKEFRVKHSRSLRNLINRLKKSGDYQFEMIKDPAAIKALLPDLFHLHITRWANSHSPSYLMEAANRRFIERLVDRLAPQGKIFVCVSHVDRLPVCYTLNFEIDKVMTGYTLAHNQYFYRYSPGRVHGVLQSEYLVQNGYDLDLSRGDTPFKRTINAEPSDNYGITIYRTKQALRMRRFIESFKAMALLRKLRTKPQWDRRIENLNMSLRHRGLSGTFLRPLARLGSWIYSSERVAIFRFERNRMQGKASLEPNFELKEIKEFDLNRFLSFNGIGPDSEKSKAYHAMLEQGHKGYLLEYSGLPVASAWSRSGGEVVLENQRHYKLSDSQAIITHIRSTEAFEHLEPITKLLATMAGKSDAEAEEILAALPISRSEEKVVRGAGCWQLVEVNRSFKLFGQGSD